MSDEQPWRVGHRVPEHVYIGERPLVTMPTAALAALVVAAVNGLDPAQRNWMAMQECIAELEAALKIQRDANADLDNRRGQALVRIAELEAEQTQQRAEGTKMVETFEQNASGLRARIAELETELLQCRADRATQIDATARARHRIVQAVTKLRGCPANLESMTAAIKHALEALQ